MLVLALDGCDVVRIRACCYFISYDSVNCDVVMRVGDDVSVDCDVILFVGVSIIVTVVVGAECSRCVIIYVRSHACICVILVVSMCVLL